MERLRPRRDEGARAPGARDEGLACTGAHRGPSYSQAGHHEGHSTRGHVLGDLEKLVKNLLKLLFCCIFILYLKRVSPAVLSPAVSSALNEGEKTKDKKKLAA